jgi:hypothetical protein
MLPSQITANVVRSIMKRFTAQPEGRVAAKKEGGDEELAGNI